MALFTDSNISSLENLKQYDSSVLDVAKTEGIELSSKMAIADHELGLELEAFLLRQQSYSLQQVVVTPALRHWHTLKTLELVYSDVYHSQLNDRYLGKWNMFRRLSKNTAELFFLTGVGIVFAPLHRASPPSITIGGIGGDSGSYLVSIAWRNSHNDASAPSEPRVFEALDFELMNVDPGPAPGGAVAFDVYVALNDNDLKLQTHTPVTAGLTWIMPGTGVVVGPPPLEGQDPDIIVRLQRILQRG
jgi:hypothetical protein